ncbi:MAG TPA: hypothetical protein VN903_05395 [Polyangia bacterium]|jgi:hypothetical protein|nr:hypothetical protein [Polyangia bacterium]
MRPRPAWLASACVSALLACSQRPLPWHDVPVQDAGVDLGVDLGLDVGQPLDAGGAQPGVLDWGIPVGTQPSVAVAGSTTVKAVVVTDDGGAVVAGSFTGMVAFAPDAVRDGTPGSGFVARYRRDQRLVWVQVLRADPIDSNDGHVVVSDLAALGDGEVAVAGWFDGRLAVQRDVPPDDATSAGGLDAFVARLAADGSVRWTKRAGGPGDDIVRGVAAGSDANGATSIALTGAIADGAVFGRGEAAETRAQPSTGPIFAARLNGDGLLAWARFAGGGVPGQGYGVAHDGAGAVAVTGYVNGVASFGKDASGAAVAIDPAIGRAFVARWDVAGSLAWALPIGGPAGEGDAIAIGAGGAIVAAGLFQGQARFGAGPSAPTLTADAPGRDGCFLAAFSTAGATVWARRLVGIGLRAWRLRASSDGDLLVAASFGGGIVLDPDGAAPLRVFSSGSTEALFARLGSDGTLRWATAGGGPGDEQGADFTGTRDGASWAVGTYHGPAVFGEGSAFGAGMSVTLESGTDGGSFLLRLLAP